MEIESDQTISKIALRCKDTHVTSGVKLFDKCKTLISKWEQSSGNWIEQDIPEK